MDHFRCFVNMVKQQTGFYHGSRLSFCMNIFIFLLPLVSIGHTSDLIGETEDALEVSITRTNNNDRVYKPGELIFSDDFNMFDLETWNHEITLGGNREWEFQMYVNSRANSYTKNGKLYIRPTLTSDRYGVDFVYNGQLSIEGSIPVEECTSTSNWGCYRSGNYPDIVNPVMSAKIQTVDSFYFKYGRVEIRAKIPSADWTTTTFVLLPRFQVYGGWPASGQIEIMKSRGNKNLTNSYGTRLGSDVVSSVIHFGPDYKRNGLVCTYTTFQAQPDNGFDLDFHTYSIEWTEEQITFFVDNMTLRVIRPPVEGFWYYGCFDNSGKNPWAAAENKRMAPFDQKFYLVLQVNAGGANGGIWPADVKNGNGGRTRPWTSSSTAFLEFYEALNEWYPSWEGDAGALIIDYIRVYAI